MENETPKQKFYRVVAGLTIIGLSLYLMSVAIKTYKTK